MSETVAEFMQKPMKKYACGSKAQDAKKTLFNAFTASEKGKKGEETALFKKILDTVMKTEKGRETMTALSGLGYSFAFETGPWGGFCDPNNKKIVINASSSFPDMLQAAVHEGTHAIQYSLKKENAPEYWNMNAASMLRCRRAVEADAVAHEMAFAYECKDIIPEVYQNAEKTKTSVFKAYAGEMEKSGDGKKAIRASFAAWYECDDFRRSYDCAHVSDISRFCMGGKWNKMSGLLSEEYPAEDVVKMCRYKGESYITPDFLNKGLAFSIPTEDKKAISATLRNYAEAVGEKPDTSLSTMRERTADGKLLPEKKAVKAAVVARAKQEGR